MSSIGMIFIICGVCCFIALPFVAGLTLDSSIKIARVADTLVMILTIASIFLLLIGVLLRAVGY